MTAVQANRRCRDVSADINVVKRTAALRCSVMLDQLTDRAAITVQGTIAADVPLVAGRIERLAVDAVMATLNEHTELANRWLYKLHGY